VVVSSANRRRRTLLGAFVATAIVTTLILSRVIATVFFAITVGYVLFPIRQRLVNLGRRRRVAAATATLIGLLAGLITVVPIFAALYIRRTVFLEFIRGLPPEVPVEAFGFAYVIDVEVVFQFIQRGLTSIAVSSARAAPVIGLKAALFVFLVYALLLRPHEIRAALLELVPPSYHDVTLSFHKRIRSTLYAIYVLQAATAFGTFLIAYVVFTALGYQSAFTLAVFAGLLQFIPVVGPIGQSTAAILVVVLGLVLVGFLPDALIRPRLASFTAGMPGSLYFVGFIGGVLTVGIIGFIAGPLAVAVLIEAADQLTEEVGVEPVKEG
jgi:predicted PurR-regulated permease PerM